MKDMILPHGTEPREVLLTAVQQKAPAIMTYLAERRWHVAKVLLTDLGVDKLTAELLPDKRPRPINIRPEQPVGISLKHTCGKIIFETKVLSLAPPSQNSSGGTLVLAVPSRIEIVERRNYFRVTIPAALKVNIVFWHRDHNDEDASLHKSCPNCKTDCKTILADKRYWQGALLDLSAGGAQIAVDASQKQCFRKGQFLTIRFTPLPYEKPLMFNVQIRTILPTIDDSTICLGLQIVGLEASPEGHEILREICSVVERYYKMNQAAAKEQTPQTVSFSL
jgi:hypothetical protein